MAREHIYAFGWATKSELDWITNQCFRINDFMEFLERHRFKEFKLHEITAYLKNKGATHDSKKIKGKFTNVWQIPNFIKQQEEFTQPKIEKEAYE